MTVLFGFLTAWVLAGAVYISWEPYAGSFLTSAVVTAVLLWIGFTATRLITHDAFEGRPPAHRRTPPVPTRLLPAADDQRRRVHRVRRPLQSDLIERSRASDFLVFDDWGVVALLYGDDGAVREARLVTDPS